MAKLSQKELETLQSLNNEFTKTKSAIAEKKKNNIDVKNQ